MIVVALTGLVVIVAALIVLAIPLLSVPGDAQAANRDLTAAGDALQRGDVRSARESVTSARARIDAAQDDAQGIGGDVWRKIPVLGTPVADAQHLVQALDDATAVATIGVDLYPSVAGKRATLFRKGQVDQKTLDNLIAGASEAAAHLLSARSELTQVRGTSPIIGDTIAARRDEAIAQVDPLVDGFTRLQPMLNELPAFLGFEGKRIYLIAMLNPAELRYSGGAALAFAPMSWDQGRLEIGKAQGLVEGSPLRTFNTWLKVKGNSFHGNGASPLVNSTFAPSWSVSGEELLRAWRSATGDRYDGVVAVDVVTMSRLLEVTGPATVPGLGELTSDNLVQTLVGSYDDYYPDATALDKTFDNTIASLLSALFTGGEYIAKGQAFKGAADGRHLALYLRDPDVQAGFTALGLDGDLTEPAGDYLGVFTISTVGSKVDYYQRRSIALDVTLDRDGSASNQLDVLVHNDTPPYAVPGPDPREGYFTRWANINAAVFLPENASVESFSVGGQPREIVRKYYDYSYVRQGTVIPPGESTRVRASYSVSGAAEVGDSGTLTYHLAMDPQGTVFPASAEVTVHLPDGYRATAVPEGWSAQGNTLTFRTDALNSSEEWEITLETSD